LSTPLAAATRRARLAVGGGVLALCLVFVAWHATRFSARTALLAATLGVVPWLALARGLGRASPRSAMAGLLLTTPFIGYGLMEVLANPGARPWAAATVFVGFALAVTLVALLRLTRPRGRAPRARTEP
jgi:uncharacterized membrane protein